MDENDIGGLYMGTDHILESTLDWSGRRVWWIQCSGCRFAWSGFFGDSPSLFFFF